MQSYVLLSEHKDKEERAFTTEKTSSLKTWGKIV